MECKKIFVQGLLSFAAILAISLLPLSEALSAGETGNPIFYDFPLPRSIILCGEPMPLDNPYVYEMLDRELTINAWDQAQVFMWLKRVGRYFPYIEKRLREEGMPDDLKYLCVAESAFIPYARSTEGALGLWQFMSYTARDKGLRKDAGMDERLDFERSTDAALSYLKQLKEMFGAWNLALAAYNCGEGRLDKEIKEQRVKDYYRLDLPIETERFVFRITAIKLILENPKLYGYFLPEDRGYKPVQCDAVPITVSDPVHIADLAQSLGIDFKIIKELNLQIQGYYLPPGKYPLKVPAGMGMKVGAFLEQLSRNHTKPPPAKANNSYYVVRPGDTLNRISQETGISIETLRRLNNLQGTTITIGQKLQLAE